MKMDLNGYLPTLTNHVSQRTTCHVIHFLITFSNGQNFTHELELVSNNPLDNVFKVNEWFFYGEFNLWGQVFDSFQRCFFRLPLLSFRSIFFPFSLHLPLLSFHSIFPFSLYFWVVFPFKRFSPFTKLTAVRTCRAYLARFFVIVWYKFLSKSLTTSPKISGHLMELFSLHFFPDIYPTIWRNDT